LGNFNTNYIICKTAEFFNKIFQKKKKIAKEIEDLLKLFKNILFSDKGISEIN